jgi:signal transduction histidine kinase
MIFSTVIRAMYAISTAGLTHTGQRGPYNAAMDETAAAQRRLLGFSPRVVDAGIVIALMLVIQGDGFGLFGADASFHNPPVNAAVALFMTLPLIWRRRYPLLAFVLVLFGLLVTFTSDVTSHTPLVWASIITLVLAAYSVGVYSRHNVASLAALALTATLIVIAFGGGLPAPPDFVIPYALLILPWLVGHTLRTRELRADAYRERAMRLEQEQTFATQAALAEERARIARELHDVVAHNVSVMVVQAGAARSILGTSPEEVREALLAVEASGREAMSELRTLLGVLSHEGDGVDLAPQPGLEQVQSLVQRVCDASLPVELHIEGTRRPLPPGINLTAYRIVQEALTNALKYAGLARTEVILDYRDEELKVEVLDDGPGERPGANKTAGRGLAGMRERVALYGGRLEAGPRLERGYAVRAWLPLPKESP